MGLEFTRDPDFSERAAQLVATFSRCADGATLHEVLNAAVNFLAASVNMYAVAAQADDATYDRLIEMAIDGLRDCARSNRNRRPRAGDVAVRLS